jgi:hypothetical protein
VAWTLGGTNVLVTMSVIVAVCVAVVAALYGIALRGAAEDK